MAVHDNESLRSLIYEWGRRALMALDAHYDAQRFFARRNYWIGIPAMVLAAVVGTSVFATLEQEVDIRIKVAVGTISLIAAVLSTLQTFLKYSERADAHKRTAARYSAVKREIEQLLTLPEDELRREAKTVDTVRKKLDELGLEAPELPGKFVKSVREKYRQQKPPPVLPPPSA